MFNKTKVISSLNGLVGWTQPFDPALPTLSAANLAATSGYHFNENPFVKLDMIKDTQDFPGISEANFNVLLTNIQNNAISNILNSVFNESDYIDRQVLYRLANNKVDLEVLPDGFVGYQIEVNREKDLAFEISRVILEFAGTGTIKLMLFNSAKSGPIQSKEITITSSLQEEVLNWRVDNTETFYKGKFFLGYLTAGLTVTPYLRNYQGANVFSDIEGIEIDAVSVSGHSTEMIFDLTTFDYSPLCFGLNPDITVFDDFTDLIIQNKFLFSRAIQMQGQIEVLKGYMASNVSSRNERISKELLNKIIVELDGIDADVKVTGLKQKLYGEISRIRKEVKRLKAGYFPMGFMVNQRG